jgi:hypothetical protein
MPVVFVVAIRDRSDDCCCDSGGIEDVHVFDTMEDANRFCAWYVEDHRAIKPDSDDVIIDHGCGTFTYFQNRRLRLMIYERSTQPVR